MKLFTWKEHFLELKNRILYIFAFFIIAFFTSYYFSGDIFLLLLEPLGDAFESTRKVIYTGLAEAFITYIKLSGYAALYVSMPFVAFQIYLFISPGLYSSEKKILFMCLFMGVVLFYFGSYFVFTYVMPRAWEFFLSFENPSASTPIILEAKISEYLSLVLQLTGAFGLAFQLPVIMVIACLLDFVGSNSLKRKRRFAIVLIFIAAAIFTPPDVISQIALAIPLLMLYEISIALCKLIEKKQIEKIQNIKNREGETHAGHKMD